MQALGKYEVRGTLGRGAMGIVYDGWDPLIARRVAIKAVRLPEHPEPETEEEIARFRREAQAAGRLSHPNIVAVYDYGETSELAYIVMEFVDGTTLKNLLDRQERFAVTDTARIIQDVLSGLEFSHARGVIHRDIKPANVILTSSGQAKIADFGIARIESSSMTQAGTVLGTPAYMSPEQFMGQVVDARTDIYSTGVLLYQLLTGERPFEGSMTAIMHKVLNTDPPPPSQLAVTSPVALDAVVRRAMSKRPEDRYPSAASFAEAIAAALAERPAPVPLLEPEVEATLVSVPVRPPSPPVSTAVSPPPSAAKRSSLPLFIAAAVAGIAVLATGGWFVLRPVPATDIAASQPSGAPTPSRSAAASPPSAAASTAPTPASQEAAGPSPAREAATPAPTASPPRSAAAIPPAVVVPSPAVVPPSATPPAAPEATASIPPPPAADRPTEPKPEPPPAPSVPPPAVPAAASPPTGGTSPSQPVAQPVPSQSPSSASVAPEQVAAIGLGSLRREIERVLASTPCTLVDGVVQDSGTVTVTGMAGRSAEEALRHEVADAAGSHALDWHVQRIDPVFCDALAALQPVTPLAGAPDMGLQLALDGGRTALHDDEYIQPRLTMPSFSGRLRVDYLAHDGSLVHLYPTVADPQDHYVAVPSRTLRPGETLELGNPGAGRPQWQVAPPFGTDMIIAVASSVPLLDSPEPNQEDNGADYVRRLGRAIEAALNNGASVTGAAMLVDTLPKSP